MFYIKRYSISGFTTYYTNNYKLFLQHINPFGVISCLDVLELHSLNIHIHIFCVVFFGGGGLHMVLSNTNDF